MAKKTQTALQKMRGKSIYFIPSALEKRIKFNHRLMELVIGKKLPKRNFDYNRYISSLIKIGVPTELVQEAKAIVSLLIPYRNKHIIETCRKSKYKNIAGITPCGIKTNLVYPCYLCRMRFTVFSKGRELLTKEEELELLKGQITFEV